MSKNMDFSNIVKNYKKQMQNLFNSEMLSFSTGQRSQIPAVEGIYVIFEKKEKLLYVGIGKNLKRRLFSNHLRGSLRNSAFRRALSKEYNLRGEEIITEYIKANCSFKYLELKTPKFLEHFIIAILKPRLNK